MKNYINELEIILLSTYCDIILDVLKKHKNLSVIKVVTFTYIIKKNKFMNSNVYSASNKNDVILKSLSLLSGLFDDFNKNIQYIIKSIHLLVENNLILENSGELIYVTQEEFIPMDNTFINHAIQESKYYSDKQFLKEVVKSV